MREIAGYWRRAVIAWLTIAPEPNMLVNIAQFKNEALPSHDNWKVPQRMAQKGRLLSRPSGLLVVLVCLVDSLPFDDVNDLVGLRAKNNVLAAHQDEIVSTPFRIDFHDT